MMLQSHAASASFCTSITHNNHHTRRRTTLPRFIAHRLSRPIHFSPHSRHHRSHFAPVKLKFRDGRRHEFRIRAMDEYWADDSMYGDSGDNSRAIEYMLSSSSEGEESDGDEMSLQPITDVDLPISKDKSLPSRDSLSMATHRLGMLGRGQKKRTIRYGALTSAVLMFFLTALIIFVDEFAWKIVRVPIPQCYLLRPFLLSAVSVVCVGYLCVPLFRVLELRSMYRKKATIQYSTKKGTPTMGGLYFVPIGLLVTLVLLGSSSIEVSAAVVATIAFATIGLVDDLLRLNKIDRSLPVWMRTILKVAVGLWFSYWLYTADITTPYNMKMVIPLPAPVGLVLVRPDRLYPVLTSLSFASMANGVDLTDGLDGLAAGTAALAFIGMSIVVLPIRSELAIFGASMSGACIGFLFQNRYKASIFMGDVGALALGGALAAMASCTGLFFPLLISSGIFFLDAFSVMIQVLLRGPKFFRRKGYKLRMASLHHQLRLLGLKEPVVVAAAYAVTFLLVLCAAYVGLTSV